MFIVYFFDKLMTLLIISLYEVQEKKVGNRQPLCRTRGLSRSRMYSTDGDDDDKH